MDFLHDEEGATAVEYALIAALIATALIVMIRGMANAIGDKFQDSADKLNAAGGPSSGGGGGGGGPVP